MAVVAVVVGGSGDNGIDLGVVVVILGGVVFVVAAAGVRLVAACF